MIYFLKQNLVRFALNILLTALWMVGFTGQARSGAMDPPSDSGFINGYIGLGYGVQIRSGCDGADVCEAGSQALKLFGGYRFTPSLATEIAYFYLGKQDRTWGTGNPNRPTGTYIDTNNVEVSKGSVAFESAQTHVLTLGAALESELFPNAFHGRMMQHLRAGLAVSQVKKTQSWDLNGAAITAGELANTISTKNRVFPYLGAGLSYGLTPHIRIFGNSDLLLNPDKKFFIVNFGAGGEF